MFLSCSEVLYSSPPCCNPSQLTCEGLRSLAWRHTRLGLDCKARAAIAVLCECAAQP